jgi:peroxiredoxin
VIRSVERATAVADVALLTPDGERVTLAGYAGRALVVQFVRYFGCLPCQVYLRELDARATDLARIGARAIAVGGSAAYQAHWLRDTGVTVPLLLDPSQELRRAVGFGNLTRRQMLSRRGVRNYAAAVLSGVRPQRPTADVTKSPGIAILGPALDVRWTYEGTALGDYPHLDVVLEAAAIETTDGLASQTGLTGGTRP